MLVDPQRQFLHCSQTLQLVLNSPVKAALVLQSKEAQALAAGAPGWPWAMSLLPVPSPGLAVTFWLLLKLQGAHASSQPSSDPVLPRCHGELGSLVVSQPCCVPRSLALVAPVGIGSASACPALLVSLLVDFGVHSAVCWCCPGVTREMRTSV